MHTKVKNSLKHFSENANKSTLNSHPKDKQRWLNFVYDAICYEEKLCACDIENVLHDSLGWSEEDSHTLALYFEDDRDAMMYGLSEGAR